MKKKTEAIYVLFDPETKEKLVNAAKKEERTLQAQIRVFVNEGLERLNSPTIQPEYGASYMREKPAPITDEPLPPPPPRNVKSTEQRYRSPLRQAREQAEQGDV